MRFLSKISDKYRRHLIMATMLVAILPSCIKEDLGQEGVENETIRFEILDDNWNQMQSKSLSSVHPLYDSSITDTLFLQVSTEDMATRQTKGSPVTTEKFHQTMGISAYRYKGSWTEELTPDFIYNEIVKEEDGWTTDHRWPGSAYNIRFFAYAPYGCEGLTLSGKDHAGSPQLTYVVPSDVQNQTDLVAAATGELAGNSNADAGISFSHILTALRIVTADDILPGTISEITLKNVYGAGTYSYATGSWEPSDNTDFTISREIITDGTADQALADGEYTFMMIPQILPAEAELNITFKEKATSTTHNLTASIAGIDFPTGQTVTFRISTSSISIEPTLDVKIPTITYAGGKATISVNSYTTVTSSAGTTIIEHPWSATFVEQKGNTYTPADCPSWLQDFTYSGSGDSEGDTFEINVQAQEGIVNNQHTDYLRTVPEIQGTYDLSTKGGTEARNTANCYIVNAPGNYSLPLVYGNAIKNGTANESSYRYDGGLNSTLSIFQNHLGAAITDPYIYNNANCTPDNAIIIWQDSPGILSNVTLDSDRKNILFRVNPETINQGNALIAVRNSANEIMWSWHIWVTDYIMGSDNVSIPTSTGEVVEFCTTAIGLSDKYTIEYARRSAKLMVTQTETGESIVVDIVQPAYTKTIWWNAPYYVPLRKDPFVPWCGDTSRSTKANKTYYNNDGTASTEDLGCEVWSDDEYIRNSILKPDTYTTSSTIYHNLWNNSYDRTPAESSQMNVTKTIYDPCPAGYTMPISTLLIRLMDAPGSWTNVDDTWKIENPSGGEVLIYCLKLRDNNSGKIDTAGKGKVYIVSSEQKSQGHSFFLSLTQKQKTAEYYSSSYAGVIYPIKEKE